MSIATIEVSLSALQHNVAFFRKISPNSQLMAIVKANAYSHGKEQIANALDGRVDYFGVARLAEGIALRKAGITSPIILLEGFFAHDDIQLLIDYELQTIIHCTEQLNRLEYFSAKSQLTCWFKLDTGMHRLGFRDDNDAIKSFTRLANCQSVKKPINIISHFSSADALNSDQTLVQMAKFDQFIDAIADCSLVGRQSLAASGGILAWPASHRDIIRPGIALYGVSPFAYTQHGKATGNELGLKPVMTLKSEIITIREHKQGESVGYGLIWQSPHDTYLGVVAMGYGDGYPRDIAANTQVCVNNRLVPIVGRVAMDMVLIDLGPNMQDQAGDEVIFWGNSQLPVEKIAANSNMSAYELLTRLTQRAQINYID